MGYANYGHYGYAGGMGGYGGYGGWGGYGGYGYGSGVGAWGMGSPMYGWGYSNYNNAYSGLGPIGGGGNQPGPPPFDYSQPISTTAAAPSAPVASTATADFDQARDAFKQGNYALAVQLGEQALGQMPNDPNIHQFLALGLFAQGQYDQAAAPLYAVLTIGPGWNWTTLIGAYAEADTYTQQLRALEAYIRANPQSAPAHFVAGYHYLTQGHNDAAAKQFEQAAGLQPSDKLSAQLAAQLQPPASQQPSSDGAAPPTATASAESAPQGKLAGRWAATPAKDARVGLAINDDGNFTWTVTSSGQPAKTITGKSTFANGVLTLAGQDGQVGALAGQVAWQDDNHMTFRVLGAPQDDPGLKFETLTPVIRRCLAPRSIALCAIVGASVCRAPNRASTRKGTRQMRTKCPFFVALIFGGLLAWLSAGGRLPAVLAADEKESAPARQPAGSTTELARAPVMAQEVLPFPPTPSASIAGRTMQESVYHRRVEPRRLPADAPNILIVLIDDAGPGLPSTYGGEVRTPTLDRIAKAGISYNRFHTTAMCSPTRAALLTGATITGWETARLPSWPTTGTVTPASSRRVAPRSPRS